MPIKKLVDNGAKHQKKVVLISASPHRGVLGIKALALSHHFNVNTKCSLGPVLVEDKYGIRGKGLI